MWFLRLRFSPISVHSFPVPPCTPTSQRSQQQLPVVVKFLLCIWTCNICFIDALRQSTKSISVICQALWFTVIAHISLLKFYLFHFGRGTQLHRFKYFSGLCYEFTPGVRTRTRIPTKCVSRLNGTDSRNSLLAFAKLFPPLNKLLAIAKYVVLFGIWGRTCFRNKNKTPTDSVGSREICDFDGIIYWIRFDRAILFTRYSTSQPIVHRTPYHVLFVIISVINFMVSAEFYFEANKIQSKFIFGFVKENAMNQCWTSKRSWLLLFSKKKSIFNFHPWNAPPTRCLADALYITMHSLLLPKVYCFSFFAISSLVFLQFLSLLFAHLCPHGH